MGWSKPIEENACGVVNMSEYETKPTDDISYLKTSTILWLLCVTISPSRICSKHKPVFSVLWPQILFINEHWRVPTAHSVCHCTVTHMAVIQPYVFSLFFSNICILFYIVFLIVAVKWNCLILAMSLYWQVLRYVSYNSIYSLPQWKRQEFVGWLCL